MQLTGRLSSFNGGVCPGGDLHCILFTYLIITAGTSNPEHKLKSISGEHLNISSYESFVSCKCLIKMIYRKNSPSVSMKQSQLRSEETTRVGGLFFSFLRSCPSWTCFTFFDLLASARVVDLFLSNCCVKRLHYHTGTTTATWHLLQRHFLSLGAHIYII